MRRNRIVGVECHLELAKSSHLEPGFQSKLGFVILARCRNHISERGVIGPSFSASLGSLVVSVFIGPFIARCTPSRAEMDVVFMDRSYQSPSSAIDIHVAIHRKHEVVFISNVVNSISAGILRDVVVSNFTTTCRKICKIVFGICINGEVFYFCKISNLKNLCIKSSQVVFC